MYIEASNPRHPGQKAGLISPQATKGPHCLTFWYHMYGSNIGRLNVYTRIGSNRGSAVWTRAANQGNKWNVAQVTLNPTADWNVSVCESVYVRARMLCMSVHVCVHSLFASFI